MFCIEIFSGSGRLTATLRMCGLKESYGIDHLVSKHVRSPTLKLDLNTEDGRAVLFQLLEDPDLCYVHLAPPCGTASRARDLRRREGYDPPQLRTEWKPDGLDNLPPVLAKRVQLANSLYHLTGVIACRCYELGILFSIENPWRSHFWATSFFSEQVKGLKLQTCIFDHCMYGSGRAKRTKLMHVIDTFSNLSVTCDDSHTHTCLGAVLAANGPQLKNVHIQFLCAKLCLFKFASFCFSWDVTNHPIRLMMSTTTCNYKKCLLEASPKGNVCCQWYPSLKMS